MFVCVLGWCARRVAGAGCRDVEAAVMGWEEETNVSENETRLVLILLHASDSARAAGELPDGKYE